VIQWDGTLRAQTLKEAGQSLVGWITALKDAETNKKGPASKTTLLTGPDSSRQTRLRVL